MEVLREGYRILFSRGPPLSDQPLPMPSYSPSSIRGKALEREFLDLLHKRAIEQAPQQASTVAYSWSRRTLGPGDPSIHCRPSPLAMLLVYMPASLQSPPSHWPSPRYDDFISSGLRALYRCPLRGPRYLLPGEGMAPATVSGAETAS